MRRVGTNFTDRNEIKKYYNAGVNDAQRIGRNLNVEPKAVQGYLDSLTEPAVEAAPEPEVACEPEPEEEVKAKPRRRKSVPTIET
jgi:hypothetical protein